MKGKAFDDLVVKLLREDPKLAAEMLNGMLEDGDQSELLTALRQMAKAFGGVPQVAEQAHLNPTQLYRTLTSRQSGNQQPLGHPQGHGLAASRPTHPIPARTKGTMKNSWCP